MYVASWQTPLWLCDSESCILSFLLPCHIYSKINSNYAQSFMTYGCCIVSLRLLYYWTFQLFMNACPSNLSVQCLGLGNDCSKNYIIVDGIPTSCIYRNDIEACTYNMNSCIQVNPIWYIWIGLIGSLMYIYLFLMNGIIRKKIRYAKSIPDSNDICESTILSPCGLAQSYREIV
jgi:hypothetical protein